MNHREYLVRHGLLGDIGRFRSSEPLALGRGTRVVISGPHGPQMGEIVRPAGRGGPGFGGDLLRAADPDDEARHARLSKRARDLLAHGNDLKANVEFLDAEIFLDGGHAALLHVCPAGTDLTRVRRSLEQESGLVLTMHDLTRPEPAGGCGDCGSGGGCGTGGCSTGGCGTGGCGSAKPAEVKEYFAELRGQMERRMPLL